MNPFFKVKRCATCDANLPISQFYKCSRLIDGLQSKCKNCMREYAREYYLDNKSEYLKRSSDYSKTITGKLVRIKAVRKYGLTEKGIRHIKNYAKSDKIKITRYNSIRSQRIKFPEKFKCRHDLNNAIRAKKIIKRNICEICYTSPTQCHHDDYSKPFDFVELCRRCHGYIHRTYKLTT